MKKRFQNFLIVKYKAIFFNPPLTPIFEKINFYKNFPQKKEIKILINQICSKNFVKETPKWGPPIIFNYRIFLKKGLKIFSGNLEEKTKPPINFSIKIKIILF